MEKEAIQRGSVAIADLVQAIRIEDGAEEVVREPGEWDRGSEVGHVLAEAAWMSIQQRRRWIPASSSDGYPFTIDSRRLRAEPDAEISSYGFLLGLNYVQYEPGSKSQRMAKVFEHLCCYAAERYLGDGAASHAFGWPRTEKTSDFIASVNTLCKSMGEGGGFSNKLKPKQVKDDGLDVVAWKCFPDDRMGKAILFGQCATGRRWDQKLADLNADAFMRSWFTDSPKVLSLFFVPEIVSDEDDWKRTTYNTGIVFDRCRIAALAGKSAGGLHKQWEEWSRAYLRNAS
jgi:hypothetical protein